MSLLREKFQTEAPDQKESHKWVSPESARRGKGADNSQRVSATRISGRVFNQLPPGDNSHDQQFHEEHFGARVMAGSGDVTDTTTRQAFRDGYVRRDVKPTDDMYTGEHADTFYGEAVSDGDVGFVERGNTLDRI